MIIEEILKQNPQIKKEDLIFRSDGRIEWGCEHGIGHTVYSPNKDYIHGCDGCCKKLKIYEIVSEKTH